MGSVIERQIKEGKKIFGGVLWLNAKVFGFVLGLFCGLSIFAQTIWLAFKGVGPVGPHLKLLSKYFIGYEFSFLGSFIGFAYAFDNNNDGNLDTDDGTVSGNIIWAFDADPTDEFGQLTMDLDTGLPLVVPVSLSNIRAVRIWILARTGAPVRGHFDNRTYAVGDRNISCSDEHPRRLTRATVYCRNTQL